MGWTTLSLGGLAATEAFQEAFLAVWMRLGAPTDAIIYSQKAPVSGPTVLYLSPAATKIMREFMNDYGAVECSAPADDAVGHFVSSDPDAKPSFHA